VYPFALKNQDQLKYQQRFTPAPRPPSVNTPDQNINKKKKIGAFHLERKKSKPKA
jgi:hypothetical protein